MDEIPSINIFLARTQHVHTCTNIVMPTIQSHVCKVILFVHHVQVYTCWSNWNDAKMKNFIVAQVKSLGLDSSLRVLQAVHLRCVLYRVSHKKRNGGFSVACDLKVPYLLTFSNQATPAEENDTKII